MDFRQLGGQKVISFPLHGSGSTSTCRCYWDIKCRYPQTYILMKLNYNKTSNEDVATTWDKNSVNKDRMLELSAGIVAFISFIVTTHSQMCAVSSFPYLKCHNLIYLSRFLHKNRNKKRNPILKKKMKRWCHLYTVFTYIYSLLIEKDLQEHWKISVKFPHIYMFHSSRGLSFSSVRNSPFQSYFCVIHTLEISVSTWFPVFISSFTIL